MHELQVQCPYCFEVQFLEVAPDERGEMVQDCDVCCRPWQVTILADVSGELQAVVERAQ